MTTKHTPGPWEVHSGSVYASADESRPIADMRRDETAAKAEIWPTERDANARLIAAAPDLLEALRAFLRAPSVGSDGPGSSTIVVQSFVLQDASDAIAKATGEKMPQYTDRHARAAIAKATGE